MTVAVGSTGASLSFAFEANPYVNVSMDAAAGPSSVARGTLGFSITLTRASDAVGLAVYGRASAPDLRGVGGRPLLVGEVGQHPQDPALKTPTPTRVSGRQKIKARCFWASHEPLLSYHDKEWGKPLHDERKLFEFLILKPIERRVFAWRPQVAV